MVFSAVSMISSSEADNDTDDSVDTGRQKTDCMVRRATSMQLYLE